MNHTSRVRLTHALTVAGPDLESPLAAEVAEKIARSVQAMIDRELERALYEGSGRGQA